MRELHKSAPAKGSKRAKGLQGILETQDHSTRKTRRGRNYLEFFNIHFVEKYRKN